MSPTYSEFLASKALRAKETGLSDVPALASHLFPFQRTCVEFALRAGSAGNFLSTGLGKTACELEWSAHAAEATNGKALILAPLSVGWQIAKEAERWGYDARVIRDQDGARPGINICNYDRLDRLDPAAFGAVALDESSILKSFGGKTSRALIEAFSDHRFRLSATATPAPNDHMELGQVILHLPFPPSVNSANNFGSKGYYPSKEKHQFVKDADGLFLTQKRALLGQKVEGPFTYHLVLNRTLRGPLDDGDNRGKFALDYAQRVGLIENDKLAESGSWSWGECEHGAMLILNAYQPR